MENFILPRYAETSMDIPDEMYMCPRCGSDNKGWLKIISPRQQVAMSFLDIFLPAPFSLWRQRFFSAYQSILIALFLGIFTIILSAFEAITIGQALFIFAFTVMTTGGIADDLTKAWPRIRMERHLQQILPRKLTGLHHLLLRGISLIIIFAAIFPLLIFWVGPRVIHLGFNIARVDSTNTSITTNNASNQLNDSENEVTSCIACNNVLLFLIWITIVGSANVCAVYLSVLAVSRFVWLIDNQLPPPIFSSVMKLMRLAIWEARNFLETSEILRKIQWVDVKRNSTGGIDLTAHLIPYTRSESVQIFKVKTNIWGRILSAEIHNTEP